MDMVKLKMMYEVLHLEEYGHTDDAAGEASFLFCEQKRGGRLLWMDAEETRMTDEFIYRSIKWRNKGKAAHPQHVVCVHIPHLPQLVQQHHIITYIVYDLVCCRKQFIPGFEQRRDAGSRCASYRTTYWKYRQVLRIYSIMCMYLCVYRRSTGTYRPLPYHDRMRKC